MSIITVYSALSGTVLDEFDTWDEVHTFVSEWGLRIVQSADNWITVA